MFAKSVLGISEGFPDSSFIGMNATTLRVCTRAIHYIFIIASKKAIYKFENVEKRADRTPALCWVLRTDFF